MNTTIIHRRALDDLRRDIHRPEIAFLIGPRQAGKTTLMQIIQKELKDAGEKTAFLSLDYDQDRVFFDSQQHLLKKIELEIGKSGFVFIDEIGRINNAGIFLKGLQDMGLPYKFIVSGSGSVDLRAEIRESMLGRKRIYEVFPLNLLEFVNYKTDYQYSDRLSDFFALEHARSEGLLLDYMNFGGYPRVVLESQTREKNREMDEIYQGYIARDIAYLLKVEKIESYSQLIRTLADQTGRIINYSELSSTLSIALPTVKNYCWYAEETYILRRIRPFYRNLRSEITKAPTVYFHDLGLRNFALGIFGNVQRPDDLGFVFQNLVYLILREKIRFTGAHIHFWRTTAKTEIDFILDTGREVIPIEVKFQNMDKPSVPRAFDSFITKYSPSYCLVVNKKLQATIRRHDTEVRFVTIWDLLLGDVSRNI